MRASSRDELSSKGASFEFSSDTEVLGKLIGATSGDDLVEVLKRALPDTKAAYCLLFLTGDRLVAVRDSLGIRPLASAVSATSMLRVGPVTSSPARAPPSTSSVPSS